MIQKNQQKSCFKCHSCSFISLCFLFFCFYIISRFFFTTGISHNESQSEKQAKENKSKCKQIARILTNAPNPQNKGAVLFKKRQQRVKKFTLVSYGTGDSRVESEDQVEEETQEVTSAEYNFVATSESEFEEEYSVQQQQQQLNLSVNWRSIEEMEALPGTKGKGVFMFAQRRQRIDQIVSEQDELRNREVPAETSPIPGHREAQDIYDFEKLYAHSDQGTYMNVNCGQQVKCHESLQPVNQLPNVSKPTVPNRTAKPFLGFKNRPNVGSPAGIIQESKKHDLKFKVPVYAKTNPQVWSPTGDIIASRDERISVPAIKTGVLAESKRRVSSKQSAMPQTVHYYNKGERRSYIEPEEDGFSLGAEACNFMQPKTVKLKNPPPVAPKPTIDPSCPPWMRKSPSGEPFFPSRSPVSQPRQSPVGQHYLQQQKDWIQPQQAANHWDLDQTTAALQTTADAWAPVTHSSQPPLLSSANSWNQHPLQASVSMHACSPSYSPHRPASPKSKPDSAPHSVASCPPEAGKFYGQPLKSLKTTPMGRIAGRTEVGPTGVGKGTELFEKKLTRVEKFVAGLETENMLNAGAASPTLSLPNHWRYSPNVRAPPPISYNPILAPFYPPSATKQLPSTSPKIKSKPKPVPKQLNTLDIMKHQPYHLDTSLFKYDAVPEVKSLSPRPTPASKYEATKKRKDRFVSSLSSDNTSVQTKAEVSAKSASQVGSPNRKMNGFSSNLTPAPSDVNNKQATPASRPASTTSQKSSTGDSVASAFSPRSLIARGARQMAPRPNFCAKKPVVMGRQWRPVTMLHSI